MPALENQVVAGWPASIKNPSYLSICLNWCTATTFDSIAPPLPPIVVISATASNATTTMTIAAASVAATFAASATLTAALGAPDDAATVA